MGTHTYQNGDSPPPAADALDEREARFRTLVSNTRVLFMSGFSEDALVRRGASGEASVQVTKPFTPTDLLREVRSALDGERPSAPAPG